MTKEVSVIEEEFNTKNRSLEQVLTGLNHQLKKFSDIGEITSQVVDYPGGTPYDKTRYTYNGGWYDDRNLAKSARNWDIKDEIEIVKGKQTSCDARDKEYEDIYKDCSDSQKVLNEDKETVQTKLDTFTKVSDSITSALSNYNGTISNMQSAFHCKPNDLNTENLSAISYINGRGTSPDSFDDAISKLGDLSEKCTEIMGKIDTARAKIKERRDSLDEVIAGLRAQIEN